MFTLNCAGKLLNLDKPVIMGIINATPDSFYSQSRMAPVDQALQKADEMLQQGAAILDIGGQSTRPGSELISAEEELSRVLPVIEAILSRFPHSIISIDTFYSKVAAAAAAAGAGIINDISAGRMDEQLLPTVAKLKLPYVAMHMQGNPKEMQVHPHYENVTQEVLDFFIEFAEQLKFLGIDEWIADPGFGFGKTLDHNYQLLKEINCFSILDRPILMGVSRKSMIYKALQQTPEDALNGSTVLHTYGLMKGVHILRVHDVKEAKEVTELMNRLR